MSQSCARPVTPEEFELGYAVCHCGKYAHVFRASTLEKLPKGYNGELFTAPYAALSRPVIPQRYRGYLSPTYEPESSNYNKTALMIRLQRSRELLSGK